MEERIELEIGGKRADARLFTPEGAGPWPLALFLMDAGGLRAAMSAMAQRFADAGYAVLQPNLYWRSGPHAPFDFRTVFTVPEERERMMTLLRSVQAPEALADLAAWMRWAEGDPRVRDAVTAVRVVGYCMGGRLAFLAAARFPDRVVAAAAIHPGGLVNDAPESPHLSAGQVRGRLYVGAADQDASFTPAQREALARTLDAAGVRYELDFQAGARHGYSVPDAAVHDPAAAERHYQKVLELFAAA